ncbi:MAG: NUDIX hydrolase [Syntrophaceae bacterium]|nr:NUDIX hydrolase [Syntrophaceae bacterium]
MKKRCPQCGVELQCYLNPFPTVDIIIEVEDKGVVLIKRKNEPVGWAIPGGFVDYGESLEAAAVREAREETGLQVELIRQMHTYSDPKRDPRHHTITTVFVARAQGNPVGADDAAVAALFTQDTLPEPIVFDHKDILQEYFNQTSAMTGKDERPD